MHEGEDAVDAAGDHDADDEWAMELFAAAELVGGEEEVCRKKGLSQNVMTTYCIVFDFQVT